MAKGIKKEVIKEIGSISQTAIIELFRLYYNYQEDPQAVLHFHGGTNNLRSSIYFDDQEYLPIPVETEGFEVLGDQRLPRPKIRISNAGLYMSSILRKYKNLNNAKIERRRIFAKYLDDRNFDGGVNPWGMANPNARMPDDKYFISNKVAENKLFVELELVSSLELENNSIPSREVAARYCPWVYRGQGCKYGSASQNIIGNNTSDGADRPVSDVNENLFVVQDGATTWKLNPDIFDTGDNYKSGKNNIFNQSYAYGILRNRGLWNQENKLENISDNLIDIGDSETYSSHNVVVSTVSQYNADNGDNLPTLGTTIGSGEDVVVYRNAGLGAVMTNNIIVDGLANIKLYVIYSSGGSWTGGGPDSDADELYIQYALADNVEATISSVTGWTTIGPIGDYSSPPTGWTQFTISSGLPSSGTYKFRIVQDNATSGDDKIAIALVTKSYDGIETNLFDGSTVKYYPGDYVYTVSKRVEEGRPITANFYKNQRVYYVCKKTHTVSADKYPPINSEYWIKDACSKKIGGCKQRYDNDEYADLIENYDGLNNNKVLPFGGFPGVDIYAY